jgi:hypothetical protein
LPDYCDKLEAEAVLPASIFPAFDSPASDRHFSDLTMALMRLEKGRVPAWWGCECWNDKGLLARVIFRSRSGGQVRPSKARGHAQFTGSS